MFAAYGGRTQAGIERIRREQCAAVAVPKLIPKQPTAEIIPFKPDDRRTPLAKIHDEIAAVGEEEGVSLAEILGPRRSKSIVKARHKAILMVADTYPSKSLPEIGRIFCIDHTSVLYVLQKRARQ